MKRSVRPWLAMSLLVLGGAVLWMRADRPAQPEEIAPDATPAHARSASHDLTAAPAAKSARTPSDDAGRLEPSATAAKPADFTTVDLEVRVVRDEDGSPIAGAAVWTGNGAQEEPDDAQRSGPDGVTRWQLSGTRTWNVHARAPGRTPAREQGRYTAGSPAQAVVLRLVAQREVRVRLVDTRGVELTPESLGFDVGAAQAVTIAASGACGDAGGTFDARGGPKHRATPESWRGGRFAWRVEISGTEPACLHALVGDLILASQHVEVATTDVALVVDPALFARASSPFVVRVVTESDGRWIANARVTVKTAQGSGIELVTDAEGRARFERVLAGEFDVCALANGYARLEQRVRRPLQEEIVLRLPPGRKVEGRVVGPHGASVAKKKIAAYSARSLGGLTRPIATAESDLEGRFEFVGITTDAIVVCAMVDDEGSGFLPQRENLPPTCAYVEAGGDASGISMRAFVQESEEW
ncbi:MAG: carboxypeptidase-like regulatory domain-containing protein [Planctomycetota bacterium]|nr:carboxypeptidase-like regulatory domain-containing protein [Planctomycetota bacterium]